MDIKIKDFKIYGNNAISKLKKAIVLVSAGTVVMTFSGCEIDDFIKEQNSSSYTYEEGREVVDLYWAAIEDSDIEKLPSSLTELSLWTCPFVTNLDSLSRTCPNLERLSLDSCSGITDLSFIYSLKKLEYVDLNDMAGVTPELIDYLKNNDIQYKISSNDIEASKKADQIIDEIITDKMTDEEKIAAIVTYVSKNCKYRSSKSEESNYNPLETTLLEKKGVCYGIAYTTNVLLRKAGIKSFQLCDTNHSWNLIDKDGKYYYIDVTNLGGGADVTFIARPLIKYTGFSLNYMSDPQNTLLTAMSDYDNRDKIVIPQSLVDDIKKGEDEKTIIERYSHSVPLCIIEFIIVIIGISIGIKQARDAIESIKYR